jgi:hypothetical protein
MHRGILHAFALGAAFAAASCGGAGETSQGAGAAPQPAAEASPAPTAAAQSSSIQHGLQERPPGGVLWGGAQPDQNAPAPAPTVIPPPADDARRIAVDEAVELVKQGKAVIVDVRPADSYQQGHVHGALSIPETEMTQRLSELPRNKLIITYCA